MTSSFFALRYFVCLQKFPIRKYLEPNDESWKTCKKNEERYITITYARGNCWREKTRVVEEKQFKEKVKKKVCNRLYFILKVETEYKTAEVSKRFKMHRRLSRLFMQ